MEVRHIKYRILAGLTIALLLSVAVFLPELVGLGWHVIYGQEASFHEWRIPVPNGWFATSQGDSLTLERMLHIPLREPSPTVVFLRMHTGKDLLFRPDIWTSVQTELQNRRGYRLVDMRKVAMNGAPGYCWEFEKRQDTSRWWITCLVPSQRLSADFSGQHVFAGAFYRILPQIRWDRGST